MNLHKHTLIPSSELKSLWAIRVDDNCTRGQDRQASTTKIRDSGSFDGYHRLSRTIKLFSLHVLKKQKTLVACYSKGTGLAVIIHRS